MIEWQGMDNSGMEAGGMYGEDCNITADILLHTYTHHISYDWWLSDKEWTTVEWQLEGCMDSNITADILLHTYTHHLSFWELDLCNYSIEQNTVQMSEYFYSVNKYYWILIRFNFPLNQVQLSTVF